MKRAAAELVILDDTTNVTQWKLRIQMKIYNSDNEMETHACFTAAVFISFSGYN